MYVGTYVTIALKNVSFHNYKKKSIYSIELLYYLTMSK